MLLMKTVDKYSVYVPVCAKLGCVPRYDAKQYRNDSSFH